MTDGDNNAQNKGNLGWAKPLFWALVMFAWAWFQLHRGRVSTAGWIWVGVLILFGVANLIVSALSIFGREWVDPQASAKRLATQQRTLLNAKRN
jgi:hypothetical protein